MDNEIAVQNLMKLAAQKGWSAENRRSEIILPSSSRWTAANPPHGTGAGTRLAARPTQKRGGGGDWRDNGDRR